MLRRVVAPAVVLSVVCAAVGSGIYGYCPGIWVRISRAATLATGWTAEARQADPVGFANYASRQLQADLKTMKTRRRELAAEIGRLTEKLQEQTALRDFARDFAGEFRTEFQKEKASGGRFPIAVREAAYTEQQAKRQVSLLLAEQQGYDTGLVRLRETQDEAVEQLETLAVRIDASESELAVLSVQGKLLEVRVLSDEGRKLLAQVDELLHDNARLIAGNPVRTVSELLAASKGTVNGRRNKDDHVAAFLAEKPAPEEEVIRGQQFEFAAVENPQPKDEFIQGQEEDLADETQDAPVEAKPEPKEEFTQDQEEDLADETQDDPAEAKPQPKEEVTQDQEEDLADESQDAPAEAKPIFQQD